MTEAERQTKIFRNCMDIAAMLHGHLLQNIPDEVYEDALKAYVGSQLAAKCGDYLWLDRHVEKRKKEIKSHA